MVEEDKNSDSQENRLQVTKSLDRFIQVQLAENKTKNLELQIRKQEIASNEKIATKAIDAQQAAQSDKYTKYNKHLSNLYWFIGAVVLIVLIFCGFALKNDGKEVIVESLKVILSFAAGAFGGFHWGKNKKDD